MNGISIIQILFVTLFGFNVSWACTCIKKSTLEDDFKSKYLIVKGRIDRIDTIDFVTSDSLIKMNVYVKRVQVKVISKYKGKGRSKSLYIYTGLGNGDCGYRFEIGGEYVLFLDLVNNVLNSQYKGATKYPYTDECYRTERWTVILEKELAGLQN